MERVHKYAIDCALSGIVCVEQCGIKSDFYYDCAIQDGNYSLTIDEPCSQRNTTFNQTYEYLFQVPCTLRSHDQADQKWQVILTRQFVHFKVVV
jgi:hypothetical protein